MSDLPKFNDFHIGDILTITSGKLVSPDHIDGVAHLLSYMTGEQVYRHQIPRLMEEAKPVLLAQHPALVDIDVPDDLNSRERVMDWLSTVTEQYGDKLQVIPMTASEHEYREALSEIVEMKHPDQIVAFRI
jgi:hypothetical protein